MREWLDDPRDRFPEPEDEEILFYCEKCKTEMYKGDESWIIETKDRDLCVCEDCADNFYSDWKEEEVLIVGGDDWFE